MLAATDTCPLEVSDGDEGICTYADAVVPDNAKESSIDSTAPILQVSNPEHMQPVRSVNREDGHDANALPETPIFRSLLKHSEATGSCVVTDVEPGDVEQNLSGLREVPEQIASSGRSSISSVSTEIYIGTASMFSEAEAEAASFSTLQVDDCLHADDSTFMEVNLHRQNSWDWTSSRVDMKMVFDKCKKGSTKPPITGISGLLSRSLLIGKTRDPLIAANESEPGWKLFGRVPPRGLPNRDPKAILKMWQMFHRLELCPPEPDSMDNRLKYNTMIGRSQSFRIDNVACFSMRSQDEKVFAIANSGSTSIELALRKAWALQAEPNNFERLSFCLVDAHGKTEADRELELSKLKWQVRWDDWNACNEDILFCCMTSHDCCFHDMWHKLIDSQTCSIAEGWWVQIPEKHNGCINVEFQIVRRHTS